MIAIVHKNLACLISIHNSFVCHFFSTLSVRERVLVKNLRFYDFLVDKHHFSPEVASLARPTNPEKAEALVSFLVENGFSSGQVEKIVKFKPEILSCSVDYFKSKIEIFRELGLSSEEVAKVILSNRVILTASVKDKIIPSLLVLKGMLGSNHDVVKLLSKSASLLTVNPENTLVPNIELLRSSGIPMDRIIHSLHTSPRCFLVKPDVMRNVHSLHTSPRCFLVKPDVMRNAVDKAKEIGFNQSSNMFIHAVRVIATISKGKWEAKLQAFRGLGFSDIETLTMFKKAPGVFHKSMQKIEEVKELLLATGKFDISNIISNPSCFGCSIETRYKPRLKILKDLEIRNLIINWPGLPTIYSLPDDKFFEKFINPYLNELGEEYATKSHVKGKGR